MLLELWLCCSCLPLYMAGAINLAAIINPDSLYGREQKVAIEVAVDHFNTSASPIFLTFRNSTDYGGPATVVEDLSRAWRADIILVGAETWTEDTIAAEVRKGVPMIYFPTAPAAALAARSTASTVIRIPGRLSSQLRCIADLVGSYSWRRVIALYEDDGHGIASISFFSDALRGVTSGVELYKVFPRHDSLLDPREVIRQGLRELNGSVCRVFVVIKASPAFAIDLFQEAKALGMMKEGYVWITNDGITARLDPSVMSPYTQGVVEIKNYINSSNPSYRSFLIKFQQQRSEAVHPKEGPTVFALLAYDAIDAIGRGMALAKRKNSSAWDDITTCGGFNGLSGFIRFGGGEASPRGTRLVITNVVGSGTRELGFWIEGFGFHQTATPTISAEKKRAVRVFGSVHWPGGQLEVPGPGGWDVLNVLVPSDAYEEFVKVEIDEEGRVVHASGFCIYVFEEAARRLPYKLRYKYHRFDGTSYEDMVKQLHLNKEYYAVVADITIVRYRMEYGDFTVPYMDSGLSKVTTVRKDSNGWIFLKPFTPRTWLAIMVAFLYMGITVWFFERRSNPEYSGNLGSQIGTGMWFTYSTIFFAHGRLHSNFTKVAILIWLFVTLVLTQSYTASLSSILTVQKLEPEVTHQLEKLACDNAIFVQNYLLKVRRYKQENIVRFKNFYVYPEAFKSGQITAAYMETPYLRVFLSKFGDDFIVTGDTARLGGFGFFFRKGSPITTDVSTAILEMTEDGTVKQLMDRAFSIDLFSCPMEDQHRSKDSLDLDSCWLLFVFSGGTSTVVFLLFLLCSFTKHWHRRCINQTTMIPSNVGVEGGQVQS